MYRVVYMPDYRQGRLTVKFVGSRLQCLEYVNSHCDCDILDCEGRLCCCTA